MLDDLRNHDPNPSDEEGLWMDYDPLGGLVKLIAIAALGIAVGSVSVLLDDVAQKPANVAESR